MTGRDYVQAMSRLLNEHAAKIESLPPSSDEDRAYKDGYLKAIETIRDAITDALADTP